MSVISWDATGERLFETGVDHGVLYPYNATTRSYDSGVAWNGLTGATESPDGAEPNDLYADNIKYASLRSAETFGGTIEAYTYPDEFGECDGSASPVEGVYLGQQSRKPFGFCFRTKVGSDADTEANNYKIHIWYNCTASPSERAYETVNDSPDAITFSWEVTSTPVATTGYKAVSTITIDVWKLTTSVRTALENKLYGTESSEPTLPDPDTLLALLGAGTTTT